jgi:AGZA family xanthine/uracil permease-like MFS transporter
LNILERLFALKRHGSTVKREMLAGLTVYFTSAYIIAVNSRIMEGSGIPLQAAIFATILASWVGSMLAGLWANAPLALIPGMGVNALFTYTFVHDMGLTWQEALAVVFVAGLLSSLAAFTPLAPLIARSIPVSLKKGITVGIGLLITFIGLQKGGLIASSDQTFVAIGDLGRPEAWLTLGGLALTIILSARNVPGSFLISLLSVTLAAAPLGIRPDAGKASGTFNPMAWWDVFGSLSFSGATNFSFWSATLVLAMVIIFENVGLIQGLLEDKGKFRASFQAASLSAMMSGLLGTSPTVCSLESAAGIASGGKTGLTAVTTAFLFLSSLLILPWISWIPDSAVAAILIMVGGMMIREVQSIPFSDMTEGIPAFITLSFIPFTYSIPDGIAFGFIAYAVLKIAARKVREVPTAFFVVAALFFVQLALHA